MLLFVPQRRHAESTTQRAVSTTKRPRSSSRLFAEHQLYLVRVAALVGTVLAEHVVADEAVVQLLHKVFVEHAPQISHVGQLRAVDAGDDSLLLADGMLTFVAVFLPQQSLRLAFVMLCV